ncbi:hypothetical protein N7495_003659 [Penicillium taxi]|uniref:uncharacterized protein n=1 Tax=Penicillium taxi TaxID=168475 RepID=UPI0025456227|nr:uncharacterized protein N7495_003659 [Penicillium taxi]KAJ5898915.1 hypothetical protein N7495_003659 [Penicillium taxi]
MFTHSSSDVDDPDASAAQLLEQFGCSITRKTSSNKAQADNHVQESLQTGPPLEMHETTFEVIIPSVENPKDYKYLPGHNSVRRILSVEPDRDNPIYTIRLHSGERQTITHQRLLELKNSLNALERFNFPSRSPSPSISTSTSSSKSSSDSTDDLALSPDQPNHYYYSSASGFNTASVEESKDMTNASKRKRKQKKNYMAYFKAQFSSDDELSNNHGRRVKQARGRAVRDSTLSSSHADNRKSSRHKGQKLRNLKERQEDDYSEAESDAPKRKKYSGAREVFSELSLDDEFRQLHYPYCITCGLHNNDDKKGPLVFCQGCSSSCHQVCLGVRTTRQHLVTKIGEGNCILQCRRCIGFANSNNEMLPHLGCCAVCNEKGPMSEPLRERLSSKEEQQLRSDNGGLDPVTPIEMSRVNNIRNILFRCTGCHRAFHTEHFPHMDGLDPSDSFAGYGAHWQCHDCTGVDSQVELIVAWRPANFQAAKILDHDQIPEIEKEYLVKWKRKSYYRVTWMRGDWVTCYTHAAIRKKFNKEPHEPIFEAENAIPDDNFRVDIVFDVTYFDNVSAEDKARPEMVKEAYVKYIGLNYEDVVWESPPKPTETSRWEDFKLAFTEWQQQSKFTTPNATILRDYLAKIRLQNFEKRLVLKRQPEMIRHGELMEYQMDGVNWIYYMFLKQQNAILADDMGLGKTIQVIGFLAALIEKHKCFPFLVVCPNSTVANWRREIKTWTPGIRVVTYFGSKFSRQMAKEYEIFPGSSPTPKCHVVIASYESMIDDDSNRVLKKIKWAGLIVDEGQRLKNDKTILYTILEQMKFSFRLLLTGTPLQNNVRELFNLLQFLDKDNDAEELEEEYEGGLTSEKIRALHDLIRPFFLRRTKAQVLPFLPSVMQIIIPVSMSIVQKKLYKSILAKNPNLIKAICSKRPDMMKRGDKLSLNNILMQLRKCLCHPFIYNKDIEERTQDRELEHKHLVEASGKLQLLTLMLPKLHERGHRVLIFSQFLGYMDIAEDFLNGLSLKYCRLDGNMNARQKQQQIDLFNAPNSPYFAFLLSTRSGGVGINLATADTVIIMDPDFNPKQDMQAMSRAHRIGQQKTVLVFHLITRASVEEKIMEKGKKKMALDHVLIDRMEATEEDGEDLVSILRHGARLLFEDENSGHTVHYDSESIDKLLDRSQAEETQKTNRNATTFLTDQQPQFGFARVWQNDRGAFEEVTETEDTPIDDPVWETLLKEREQEAIKESNRRAEILGRGKRKRANVHYHTSRLENTELDADLTPNSSPFKRQKSRKLSESDNEQDYVEKESELSDEEDVGLSDAMDLDEGASVPFLHAQIQSHPSQFTPAHVQHPQQSLGLDGASGGNNTASASSRCVVCTEYHVSGHCPCKLAGVELCPLCGLAHFGGRRSCAMLHSVAQLRYLLERLPRSTESPELIGIAEKYLKGAIRSQMKHDRDKVADGNISVPPA